MKRLLCAVCIATVALTMGGVDAFAQDKSAFGAIDLYSHYIWRGQKLSGDWVLQPSAGFQYGQFAASLWANYDTDTDEHTETDLTLSYFFDWREFGFEVGYIYYGLDSESDTQELFGTVVLKNIFLTPTFTMYLDFDEGDGLYFEGAVSYAHQLPRDLTLELGALVSFNVENETTGTFSNFNTGELKASLTVPIYQDFTLTPVLGYSFPLSDQAKDRLRDKSSDGDSSHLYAGFSFSVDF